MCGIAGILNLNNKKIDKILLSDMIASIVHRGPDGEGKYIEGRLGLGHRRLSILDLSENGLQPMRSKNSQCVVTYNGEIYNFMEIRQELIDLGYQFYTQSDTEVLLTAYEAWGQDCVNRFNGMWSFGLYDPHQNLLFCSRDRFGIKPFYYFIDQNIFAFGSEIKQLLPFLSSVKGNQKVIKEFLFSSTSEPYNETFFDGILKLPGGHNLVFDLDSNNYKIHRYYELKINQEITNLSQNDAIFEYGQLLSNSVKLRLRSDVAVGTCLSGGLDSSTVATLASPLYYSLTGKQFQGITAVSETAVNDESDFAQQVVKSANLKWLTVKPSYDDFANSLSDIVKAQEEPFPSPSICMQFFVMKTAKKNQIPVLLDGQGGDETLLGYERYYAPHFLRIFREEGLLNTLNSLKQSYQNNQKIKLFTMIPFVLYFSSSRLRYFNYCYRNRYLRDSLAIPESLIANSKVIWDIIALQKRELLYDNLPPLLRYEDKNSMWHSIETRLPFVDYRVVETAISLPSEAKIHLGWTKYALRKYMENKMPNYIIWRKNKFGFEAPESLWLEKHYEEMRKKVLSSPLLEIICRPNFLVKNYSKLDSRTQWRLYSVALWAEEFNICDMI